MQPAGTFLVIQLSNSRILIRTLYNPLLIIYTPLKTLIWFPPYKGFYFVLSHFMVQELFSTYTDVMMLGSKAHNQNCTCQIVQQ